MPNHFNLEDCERFLHDENQFSPGASKRIEKYLKISREGLDEFLIRFPETGNHLLPGGVGEL